MDQHGRLFNKIAPIYHLFFRYQVWYYNKIVKNNLEMIIDNDLNTILDIGCGTGAFGYVFKQLGFKVKGVDVAPKMVKKGINNNIDCVTGDIIKGLDFDNNSFDMVTTSMVAHGLDNKKRVTLYKEQKRIANNIVLIQDYNFERKILIDFVEWLEGGSYFNFVKDGKEQFNLIFEDIKVINVSNNLNWYIANL
ncbi:MAG: class I SAM-dependent methyltransferase [Halanaerobiales bacterium]|nr:class I SAM-dependent methyltransferase [Halanaerobiales bacterium]